MSFILILLKRRAIFIMIKESGVATRRIQTDHFGLHSAIKKRFEAEGIEIAFPQRDLHVSTAGDWVDRAGAGGPMGGEESA